MVSLDGLEPIVVVVEEGGGVDDYGLRERRSTEKCRMTNILLMNPKRLT
jgi:hypothetical protein